MTIDERLEALAARHEALAQTVELMAAMQRDTLGQVTRNFEIVLESIKRLENIAASHEQRLDDLEH